jgi:hydroxyacylglutathione hydrolase
LEKIKAIRLKMVNCYLVQTEKGFILIDTGFSNNRNELEEELYKNGCEPDNLQIIILTHGDSDHTGNAEYIRKKFNSIIGIHKDDTFLVENMEEQLENINNRKTNRFISKIVIFISRNVSRIGFIRKKILKDNISFKPDIYLEDGQNLEEYGFNAKIIYTPGHTKGSIGILTNNNDFISGDLFRNIKKPLTAPLAESFKELNKSIGKVKKFGINNIYPGHGNPFQFYELKNE